MHFLCSSPPQRNDFYEKSTHQAIKNTETTDEEGCKKSLVLKHVHQMGGICKIGRHFDAIRNFESRYCKIGIRSRLLIVAAATVPQLVIEAALK